ncbi:MAG: hypothetical protein ABSD74_12465 [Rhizomicrobium sp.]|jgi:hypothetical protein
MRFGFLVAAVAAGGIAIGAAVPFISLPDVQLLPDFQAMNAKAESAADPALRHFTLADLNPLRLIFDYEQHEISTNTNRGLFAGSAPVLTPDFSWADRQQAQFNRAFDPAAMARLNGESLQNQFRQSSQHQQDIMNYIHSGGHGPSPIFP